MHKLFPHKELDRALSPAVDRPDRFEALAAELIERLDREETDLEISDPQSWRAGTTPTGGRCTLRSSVRPGRARARRRLFRCASLNWLGDPPTAPHVEQQKQRRQQT